MTLKPACVFAATCLLTWSAIAADPRQTPPDSTTPQAAAAPPQTLASPEPLIGPAQPPAEAVVEVLDAPPPPKYRDLWGRIRAGFAMREIDSPLVARHEAWYLNRPEYVQRMVERDQQLVEDHQKTVEGFSEIARLLADLVRSRSRARRRRWFHFLSGK